MLLGEVKFVIYNPPASFRSKFQGYRTAEFTGAHTVLGHLVQEAFKSPQSVDSHRAISSYISWCLRVGFLVTRVLPAWANMTFLGLFKPETREKWTKKLKKLFIPPQRETAAECLWPKQPSPSSSSRTTCPHAMPTFLAFHHISWESPISSDLVTKCLPDLLSGKNSCYSWHIQMPVQILGTPLWGVHFISLPQESISLIQRKTVDHGIAKYNWRLWWEWDAFSAWAVLLHAFLISEIFF